MPLLRVKLEREGREQASANAKEKVRREVLDMSNVDEDAPAEVLHLLAHGVGQHVRSSIGEPERVLDAEAENACEGQQPHRYRQEPAASCEYQSLLWVWLSYSFGCRLP